MIYHCEDTRPINSTLLYIIHVQEIRDIHSLSFICSCLLGSSRSWNHKPIRWVKWESYANRGLWKLLPKYTLTIYIQLDRNEKEETLMENVLVLKKFKWPNNSRNTVRLNKNVHINRHVWLSFWFIIEFIVF